MNTILLSVVFEINYLLFNQLISFVTTMDFVNFLMNIISITEISMIIDLLKFKQINHVYNQNCNYKDTMLYHKILNYNNIQAASLNNTFRAINKIPDSFNQIGIIVNTSCSDWTQVFNHFPSKIVFKNQFKWLVFSDALIESANILANFSIELDSDVTIVVRSEKIYEFYEVFHTDNSKGIFTIKKVGYWNTTLCMNIVPRRDLSGLVIRSPVVVTDKITHETFEEYLNKPKINQVDSLHKLKFIPLLNYIADIYNFSYAFQRTNSWGYTRNGSFDGIVGTLQRHEADIGGSSLFFRADRAELIDYIAETWQSRQCFILRHPKHPGGFYTIYTRPLTATVWCCILCMFTISGVILCLMLRMKIPKSDSEQTDYSFSLALLFHWSALCQQGMSVQKNSTPVKILVIVTFIYAVTLYQYYNAMVVSTLLREPPKNIRTLEDLLKSNLKAGAENVLYAKDYFKRTTDPVALRMYYKKIVPDRQYNFYTPERGMAMVRQGGFAFHVDSVVAYRIMRHTFKEREICEAHEIPLYPPQKMGLVTRKYSPYKEHFTYGVRKIYESGLAQRLQTEWDEPKPACVHSPDASALCVTLREFSTALLALLAGAAAALLVLLLEILLHKYRDNTGIAFTL